VATIVDETEAEGPGRRLALWLQGCPIRCPGCCNPEMFAEDRGTPTEVAEVVAQIERAAAARHPIEGISILGGEPFAQAEGAAEVARAARDRGLTVMVYSGYALAELQDQARTRPGITALLDRCDLLVDGRYDQTRPRSAGAGSARRTRSCTT
jgi:anaerobic ribonucleoside-triphosphate reductase activating protein